MIKPTTNTNQNFNSDQIQRIFIESYKYRVYQGILPPNFSGQDLIKELQVQYLELIHNFDSLSETQTFEKVEEVLESLTQLENSLLKQQLENQSHGQTRQSEKEELNNIEQTQMQNSREQLADLKLKMQDEHEVLVFKNQLDEESGQVLKYQSQQELNGQILQVDEDIKQLEIEDQQFQKLQSANMQVSEEIQDKVGLFINKQNQ